MEFIRAQIPVSLTTTEILMKREIKIRKPVPMKPNKVEPSNRAYNRRHKWAEVRMETDGRYYDMNGAPIDEIVEEDYED